MLSSRIGLALVIILLGFITRFIFLDSVPGNLHPDGVDTIRLYLEHRHRGDITFSSTQHNGTHILNQLIVGVPWEIAGKQYWAMRLGPAILSIICLTLFYLMILIFFRNQIMAFAVTLLFMVDPWFLNFSRSGWDNVSNCILVTVLLFVLLLPKTKIFLKLGLLMLVVILSPYLYHSGKIVALIASLVFFVDVVKSNFKNKSKLMILASFLFLVSITVVPLLLLTPAEAQLTRINAVSILSHEENITKIKENFIRNLIGFTTFHSNEWHVGVNSRYLPLDGWILHPIIILLYVVGTFAVARRRWWLVLVGFLLIYPVNLLSMNTPDAARSIHALPYIYLMVAFGLETAYLLMIRVSDRLQLLIGGNRTIWHLLINGFLVILFVGLTFQQFFNYWIWINSPRTLAVREPAIYRFEYERWLSDMSQQLRLKGKTLSIYEWKNE